MSKQKTIVILASLILVFSQGLLAQEISSAYNNARFKEAIRGYKSLADKGDIEGYLNLGIIFKDLGDYDRAIFILKKAKARFSEDFRVKSLLGRLYYLNRKTDEGIPVLEKLLKINPDDVEAQINLGSCYEDKGQDAQAQGYYERAVSLNKNSVVGHYLLAGVFYRSGKWEEALKEYKTVGMLDSSFIEIPKILADIYFRLNDLAQSIRLYQRLVLIEPNNALFRDRLNEIRARLGPQFFAKERERWALARKEKSTLIEPMPKIKNIVYVRVGILDGEKTIEFKCSVPFEVRTKSGQLLIAEGLAGENYQIRQDRTEKITLFSSGQRKGIINQPVIIKPLQADGTVTIFDIKVGKENFWAGHRDLSFRGSLEVGLVQKGINVVNLVNLEEYLYSVLPSEMPVGWPKEALKAQAIAARSEALLKLGRHKPEGFDFCAEVHCQAYGGAERENPLTNQAVDETRGIIMTYEGKVIDAVYSSNCGGHTQDNIFGDEKVFSYLKGIPDSLENKDIVFPLSPFQLESWLKNPPAGILCGNSGYENNSNFRWVRIYGARQINEMLGTIADFKEVQKIIVLKRKDSGHISSIRIIGTGANYVLEKELVIRKSLGNLRSSMFKIEIAYGPDKKPKAFFFFGGGWGHGVGMCQYGARGMADLGRSYEQILQHYFQGVSFKKIY